MRVEIQISRRLTDADNAANPADDYITWSPRVCRARLVDGTEDATVTLCNDLPSRFIFIDALVKAGDRFGVERSGETVVSVATSTSKAALATALASAIQSNINAGDFPSRDS